MFDIGGQTQRLEGSALSVVMNLHEKSTSTPVSGVLVKAVIDELPMSTQHETPLAPGTLTKVHIHSCITCQRDVGQPRSDVHAAHQLSSRGYGGRTVVRRGR